MNSRKVIQLITRAGWVFVRQTGSHRHYRHPTMPGTTTVPDPKSELPTGTLKSIEKQSGVKLT